MEVLLFLKTGNNNAMTLCPLCLRFNGRFPGQPGLAGVYWSKGWWSLVVVTVVSRKRILLWLWHFFCLYAKHDIVLPYLFVHLSIHCHGVVFKPKHMSSVISTVYTASFWLSEPRRHYRLPTGTRSVGARIATVVCCTKLTRRKRAPQ